MQFRNKSVMRIVVYISICLLNNVLLLINTRAQAPNEPTIAFSTNPDNGAGIWLMGTDGKNQRKILEILADPVPLGLVWSPDGSKLAFHAEIDANTDVYVVNANGEGLHRLTEGEAEDGWPSWHPSGKRIAFHTDRDGNFEIFEMTDRGDVPKNITNDPAKDRHPTWSHDGRKIAFASKRGKSLGDIWVMETNGGNLKNLTNVRGEDYQPRWSRDDTKIAWTSTRNGQGEVWAMDANGENLVKVSDRGDPKQLGNRNQEPSWNPTGKQIASAALPGFPPTFVRIHPASGNLGWKDLPIVGDQNRSPAWFDPDFVIEFSVSHLKKQPLTWGWIKQMERDH